MALLPKIKIKSLVSFPSNVYGGTGIDVTKANGNFTIDLDYSEFLRASGMPVDTYTLVWEPVSDTFTLVPPTATGGIPDAPTDGRMFGRQAGGWADAWASPVLTGSPTAPTPTPGDNDTSIATTAFVAAAVAGGGGGGGGTPSSTPPLMDGVAAPGVATPYSREDHVHPSDTSRQAADADLTAIAALTGTGIARRTATDTWSTGTAVTNAELATMPMFTLKANNSVGSATPTDITIASLTTKVSPAGGDYLLISDQSASGVMKKVAISTMPGASGGISEAPNDGQQYGRQSLGWTVVAGSGGSTPSDALPAMDGTANAGVSTLYSRGDHVHPVDTSLQPLDAELTAIAGLVSAADRVPYFTGVGTASLATFTSFARTLVDDADATAARTTLGLTTVATATASALTKTDDANVTLTLGGTPATALLQATSIAAGWSGTLSTARGGLGANNNAANGVPVFAAGAVTMTGSTGTGTFARSDSPVFTGNPVAPTPASGDNDTSVATTAFVTSAVGAIGVGGMSTAEYTYSTITAVPPSTGQLRADTTTQSAITAFYLHETNAVGVDITNALKLIAAGVKILVQDKTNAANVQYYQTSGPAVDNGAYFTIPVMWTAIGSGTPFTAGRVIFAGFGIGSNNVPSSQTNYIINGGFRINQGGYVSGAVLAPGAYGHDQWKAGASGGDYSFTQLLSSTQITIASGKSLIQPIEDVMVVGGSYVLSWTGTAQARAGVNTLTPSGAYAVSPLLISGQTAGTVMSVEFNTGTLGTVNLESGLITTPFLMRAYDQELLACQRYYWRDSGPTWFWAEGVSFGSGANLVACLVKLPVTMRATPTVNLPTLTLGGVAAPTTSVSPPTNNAVNVTAVSNSAINTRMTMSYSSGSFAVVARL